MKLNIERSSGNLDEATKQYIDQRVQQFIAEHLNLERKAIEESVTDAVLVTLEAYIQNSNRATREPASAEERRTTQSLVAPVAQSVPTFWEGVTRYLRGNNTNSGQDKPMANAEKFNQQKETQKAAASEGPGDSSQPPTDLNLAESHPPTPTNSSSTLDKEKSTISQDHGKQSPRLGRALLAIGMVGLLAVAYLFQENLKDFLWTNPPKLTPSQQAFSDARFRRKARVWFEKSLLAPPSRVSHQLRSEIPSWLEVLKQNKVLQAESSDRALMALFELTHACWWDSQPAAVQMRRDLPIVDFDLTQISVGDLKAIWLETKRNASDTFPEPAEATDPHLQFLIAGRWLANTAQPCGLADAPRPSPLEQWAALIQIRSADAKALFIEAQSGGQPPVKVKETTKNILTYWSEREPEEFTGDILGMSLTASFEYVHARWFLDTKQQGNSPTIDLDVRSISSESLNQLRFFLGLTSTLPNNASASNEAVQFEIVRAWLDKRRQEYINQ